MMASRTFVIGVARCGGRGLVHSQRSACRGLSTLLHSSSARGVQTIRRPDLTTGHQLPWLQQQQLRSISIGTDMVSTVISLQKARPWYNSDAEGSNLAVDNALTLKDLFQDKMVVVFGVPAPFTGTCSLAHYPPYKKLADELLQSGVDEIVCYSVTDPYAHYNWAKSLGNDHSKIRFLADTDGSFAKAYGVDAEYTAASLGSRSKRFSMLVVNGHIHAFHIVKDATKDAETILQDVKDWKENA
jgi:glutaredoxin/glutathione-dependent peroxiredoxin